MTDSIQDVAYYKGHKNAYQANPVWDKEFVNQCAHSSLNLYVEYELGHQAGRGDWLYGAQLDKDGKPLTDGKRI